MSNKLLFSEELLKGINTDLSVLTLLRVRIEVACMNLQTAVASNVAKTYNNSFTEPEAELTSSLRIKKKSQTDNNRSYS